MSASVMPSPGEPLTCDVPCGHRDCVAWRETIGRLCADCQTPVAPGQRYYDVSHRAAFAGQLAVAHALCEETSAALDEIRRGLR